MGRYFGEKWSETKYTSACKDDNTYVVVKIGEFG